MHSATHPARPTADQLAADTDWRRYVPAPKNPDARPVAVLSTEGTVTGIEDFLAGTGPLLITTVDAERPSSIVLDYGTNIAGRPWFEIDRIDEPATIRVFYSESARWAGAGGDERGGHNASANRSRVEVLTVDGPGRVARELIQGGQRYQRIAVVTPGSVAIGSLGMSFSAFRANADDYAGWFVCSDDQLNRIWYESAYTTQLNQLPADSLPIAWSIDDEGLRVKGGTLAVLRGGDGWTDVEAEFETRVVDHAAGWIIRAADDGARGYLLQLRVSSDQRNATLAWSFIDDGYENRPQDTVRRYTDLGSVDLGSDFDAAAWHRIRTAATGQIITVAIDDIDVARIDLVDYTNIPFLPHGSFGFHEAWDTSKVPGEQARFRNLAVTDASGRELFQHRLDDATVLEAFIGDGVVSPDPLPVILDGARRDRSVWSGDLIVQIPNIFYTTAAEDYVRGSIVFLNSFQEPDGRLPARMPPLFPPATPPQHGQVYSAVYSMHQITNVALHHQYTGDIDFARSQWPAIQRQLSYDSTRVDDRGLYITDEDDGLDWDWYDGPKTGAVSAYNIVYVHVLRQAAALAAAIGQGDDAAALTAQAQRTHDAIIAHLYDPERALFVLSDIRPDAIGQDANSLAILHRIAPAEDAARILIALEDALPQTPFGPQPFNSAAGFRENVSPYTSGFHLAALFDAGLTDRALTLLRQLWGHMAAPGPYAAGTVWELLNTDGTPGFGSTTSLAHGWACAPTVALSSAVLGVTPRSTAFRTWSVAPQLGDLRWARGRVPTPAGPIEVSWQRSDDALVLEVTAPIGTTGSITVPALPGTFARLHGVSDDGTALEITLAATSTSNTITFEIDASGRYTVEI